MDKSVSHFFCYSKTVSDFLYQEGIEFITVAKDMRTNKIFSLYVIDEEGKLQKALDKYNEQKPTVQ